MSLANSTLNIKDLPRVTFNDPDSNDREFAITLQTLDHNESNDKTYVYDDEESDK